MKRRDFRESYRRRKHLRLEDGRRGGGFGNATWIDKRKEISGHSPFVSFPLSSRMTLHDTEWG